MTNVWKVGMLGVSWLAVAAALSLAMGCAEDQSMTLQEPSVEGVEAVTVPASTQTTEALGISSWRYHLTREGTVVRGVAAGEGAAELASFWIEKLAVNDAMVVRSTSETDSALLPRDGGVVGGGESLHSAVAAFRDDVEKGLKQRERNVYDDLYLCLNQQRTFSTWAGGNTTIVFTNNHPTTWSEMSFQAGSAAAEVYWIQPGAQPVGYPRSYFGAPVTVKHRRDSVPDADCIRVQVF